MEAIANAEKRLVNTEKGLVKYKKYKAFTIGSKRVDVPTEEDLARKASHERAELAVRLNELARKRPFNILYRVKKHDTL
ncbi:MAG: hypothetical protein P4L51_15585 [Puia sp.]|nr:hypothetical protein [Puia sp.]